MVNNKDVYEKDAKVIYELLRKKKKSTLVKALDFFSQGVLTMGQDLKNDGAFYLIVYEHKSLLINVVKDKVTKEIDVTEKCLNPSEFKSLELEGFVYKKYRKSDKIL